jgi:hypothetical protein
VPATSWAGSSASTSHSGQSHQAVVVSMAVTVDDTTVIHGDPGNADAPATE